MELEVKTFKGTLYQFIAFNYNKFNIGTSFIDLPISRSNKKIKISYKNKKKLTLHSDVGPLLSIIWLSDNKEGKGKNIELDLEALKTKYRKYGT